MSEEEIIKKQNLYKIYKIQDSLINDLVYYGYTYSNLDLIFKKYKINYLKYLNNKENNYYNCLYELFENYEDKLEIILIEECLKEDIKEKLKNYIKNDKNSVNIRYSNNKEDLRLKGLDCKIKWRKNNELIVKDYNNEYYKNNIEKAKEYYLKIKDKIYEKILCGCGKYYCHKRKSNILIHINSKHHINYINSLNKDNII